MKRNIDLITAMRTFLVVVERHSFSAASRELNIVVSAVSRQVADLERHFNCQLLYRTTRAMHLTSEGEHYLRQFQEIIARLDNLESFSRHRGEIIAGHLKITTPQNSALIGFQSSIQEFLTLHPRVKVSWLQMNRYVDLVDEGVDLALRVGKLEDSNLVARPFGEFTLKFVASPEYLRVNGTPSHPSQLDKHRCILDSSNRHPGRWQYQGSDKEELVRVSADVEVNNGQMVAQFAVADQGVAQLPDFLLQDHIDSGRLVSILEEFAMPSIPMYLVYPAKRMKSPALEALLEFLL
ncbi:transcriptional regulator, LysR family [Shewanella sediminis HAW-EB3]|uniref:Transcriptional regulator, LysR family n=1 Tax=Shewanella sediminis (strain HAW-EB3) TaxID=425104 RepID=A8FZE5_SHESH|nr:LysR family transcriptional regulator [Shewanella sediminis]ABV38218.1 transcriptional regulator, LysR family [Shewanella sediminis HAW-EB3]